MQKKVSIMSMNNYQKHIKNIQINRYGPAACVNNDWATQRNDVAMSHACVLEPGPRDGGGEISTALCFGSSGGSAGVYMTGSSAVRFFGGSIFVINMFLRLGITRKSPLFACLLMSLRTSKTARMSYSRRSCPFLSSNTLSQIDAIEIVLWSVSRTYAKNREERSLTCSFSCECCVVNVGCIELFQRYLPRPFLPTKPSGVMMFRTS